MSRSALVLGATGLVGRHVLSRLLQSETYGHVTTLGRRPLRRSYDHHTHRLVDFDQLDAHADLFEVDDVFCCLGTTMRKAGSKAAFRRVDYDYPFAAARIALGKGAEQYLLVSALGADPQSRLFYNRVKGEVEQAIQALGFAGVYIFQPSLLRGTRFETRPGEQVGDLVLGGLSFLLQGPLRKYRAIDADVVAAAMVQRAQAQPGGVRVYPSDEIMALATEAPASPEVEAR